MDTPIIPAIDPMPLPGPVWLLTILLVVTLTVHLLAMNALVGGGIIALIGRFRSSGDDMQARMFRDVTARLPAFLAATITIGVAPLLFVQVLFGQFFYTSSVIMGWPWFSVMIILIFAYYGLYYLAFRKGSAVLAPGWILLMSLLILMLVGFINTNNFTLMQNPAIWAEKYFGDRSGWNMNLSEPSLVPRYLHMMLGALAVGGLFIGTLGILKWETERDYAKYLLHTGVTWFTITTMAQFVVGFLFFMLLPNEQQGIFMGQQLVPTIVLTLGIAGAFVLILLGNRVERADDPRPIFKYLAGLTALVVLLMVIARHNLKLSYLEPWLRSTTLTVKTQWDVLILFLVLFAFGIGLWVFMLRRYYAEVNESAG